MPWSSAVGPVELMIKFPFEIRWPTIGHYNMATEYANYAFTTYTRLQYKNLKK